MKCRRWIRWVLPLVLTALAGAASAQTGSFSISLGPDWVAVSNATPGGTVALLSAVRTPVAFTSRVETALRTGQARPGNGSFRFELEGPLPESSVWAAVDVQTGALALASPVEGAPLAFVEPLGLSSQTGTAVIAARGHPTLEFLLVRAGSGAWRAVAADGGISEGTGEADGLTSLLEPEWVALADSPASPGELLPTDLLVALDPATFELDAQVVGGLHELP